MNTSTHHSSDTSTRHNDIVRGMTRQRIQYFGLTILVTLISVLIFVGAGYLIDLNSQSKPLFTLLGVGLSYIFTQFTLVRLIKHLTSKKHDRN